MRRYRLSRLALAFSIFLTTLVVVACVALKFVPDVMAARATQLANAALTARDPPQLIELNAGIENWTRLSDNLALVIGGLVLGGIFIVLFAAYQYVLRPLFALAASMKRFTAGDREARAEPSPCVELATAADNFNEAADIITGQHERMLDFIAATTFELKDPVQVMRAALKETAPDEPPPTVPLMRQRLILVSRELDRLERLVDNYLDASRVEWKRLDLQQDRQDFGALVQEVSRFYEAFSRVHRMELSLPEEPVWVFADIERLSQVIHTLLTNAIAFSPRGGTVDVRLELGSDESGERCALLSVTDHGIGLSEGDVDAIFEPFQKMSSALQRSPGVSVALSVARRIVQAHRGRLNVSSKVGHGSTFRVCLPLADHAGEEGAHAGRAAVHDQRSRESRPEPSQPRAASAQP
jgi:signal transduction histidine kinase